MKQANKWLLCACVAFGCSAALGQNTVKPGGLEWAGPLPEPAIKHPGITVDGVWDAPATEYAKYAGRPLIEMYNPVNGRLMVFTSMQSFNRFVEASDMTLAEEIALKDYQSLFKPEIYSGKRTKAIGAKLRTANGWETDESVTVMDYPYVPGCVRDGSVVGARCPQPLNYLGRDAYFNPAWWAPYRTGDNDDSFVMTATPRAEWRPEPHLYYQTVNVSQVCEAGWGSSCDTWGEDDLQPRAMVLGAFADVYLFNSKVRAAQSDISEVGQPFTNLPREAAQWGRIYIKSPAFWRGCSTLPNCRAAFGIPDPATRGLEYFSWYYFALIPDAARIIIDFTDAGVPIRLNRVTHIQVSTYRNSVGTLQPFRLRPELNQRDNNRAGLLELASGCNASVVRHRAIEGDPVAMCAVPTAVVPSGGGYIHVPFVASQFRVSDPGLNYRSRIYASTFRYFDELNPAPDTAFFLANHALTVRPFNINCNSLRLGENSLVCDTGLRQIDVCDLASTSAFLAPEGGTVLYSVVQTDNPMLDPGPDYGRCRTLYHGAHLD